MLVDYRGRGGGESLKLRAVMILFYSSDFVYSFELRVIMFFVSRFEDIQYSVTSRLKLRAIAPFPSKNSSNLIPFLRSSACKEYNFFEEMAF